MTEHQVEVVGTLGVRDTDSSNKHSCMSAAAVGLASLL
jgi:hypothetical protein